MRQAADTQRVLIGSCVMCLDRYLEYSTCTCILWGKSYPQYFEMGKQRHKLISSLTNAIKKKKKKSRSGKTAFWGQTSGLLNVHGYPPWQTVSHYTLVPSIGPFLHPSPLSSCASSLQGKLIYVNHKYEAHPWLASSHAPHINQSSNFVTFHTPRIILICLFLSIPMATIFV